MNTIRIEKTLSGYVRKGELWLRLIDWSNYKKALPLINEIRIHEEGKSFYILEWFIILDGIPFRWMEKTKIFDDQYTVKFEAISGDFEWFKGEWKIEDSKDSSGVKLSYLLEYKLGIPIIEENCGDLLKEKIQKYVESIIENICETVYNSSKNQRKSERILINIPCLISIDNIVSEMEIVNISQKGLLLRSIRSVNTTPLNREIEINIGGISLFGYLYIEPIHSNFRIIFKDSLQETEFDKIINIITGETKEINQLLRIYDVIKAPVNEKRGARTTGKV